VAYEDFEDIRFLDDWVPHAERHSEVGTYVNKPESQELHRWLSEQLPVLQELARREGGVDLASRVYDTAMTKGWRETIQPALEVKARIDKRELLLRIRAGN
jgi:hypothetical protein